MTATAKPESQSGSQLRARRPGGRSARVRDDVYAAVGSLVGEGHLETMTVPQVAARAGVNATSTEPEELPDTGTLFGDLDSWATTIAQDVEGRTVYLRAMVASRTGMVADCPCWSQRMVQAELMITRAQERGEATPTALQVLDHIVAPLYHHAVFGLPGGPDYAFRLVADLREMFGSP